jgi:hypothetical protein
MSRYELGVSFGNVSIGDGTARLGIKLDREQVELETAEELFCGRRLTGQVVVVAADEDPNQKHLFKGDKPEIEATFDVKRFSMGPKDITTGLTFSIGDVDVETLSHFAKRKGELRIASVSKLEDASDDFDDDDADTEELAEDERDAAHGKDTDANGWRRRDVSHLGAPDRVTNALRTAGVKTLGKLSDTMNKGGVWWHHELKGVGEKAAEQIGDLFAEFWSRHPEYAQPKNDAA